MSAFGSYADAQTIDFAELGSGGLYLITGETGSGKTTIFDAISYALFGKASGRARDNYKMLRSDYASGRVKTSVSLDFAAGGAVYNITRAITPHIARKTGETTYTDSVALTLADKTTLDRDREVSAKISEIIGLDRDQFAQIVMLAQNDFLRFLQSGTDERVKILRRIFGTGSLKYFQETLKARSKEASDGLALCRRDFERGGVDPHRREEQFAEWDARIKQDKTALAEADKKLAELDERSEALAARTAVAKELSKKFEGLAATRAALFWHAARMGEMSRLEARRVRGETALRRVKPFADKAAEAENLFASARTELARAKAEAEAALAELAEAKLALSGLPSLDEKRTAFDALKREGEKAAETRGKLTALKTEYDDISAKRAALLTLQKELSDVTGVISGLPALSGEQAALEALKREREEAETLRDALSALNGDYEALITQQARLAALRSEFEKLNLEFSAAESGFNAAEEIFLRGQAGLLARALENGKPCPVCGSADHPAPACPADGSVTENELKKAREEARKARKRREDKSNECAVLRARLDTLRGRFLADLRGVIPGAAEEAGALIKSGLSAANARLAALTEKKADAEKKLSDLTEKWNEATQRRDALSQKRAELRAAAETRAKRFLADALEFIPSGEEGAAGERLAEALALAQAESGKLDARKRADETELARLEREHKATADRNAGAELKNQSARTLAAERERRETEQREKRAHSAEAFAEALRTHNFADEAEYENSLASEEELSAAAKRLSDYEKEGERLKADENRFARETAAQEKPDLEKLAAETEAVNGAKVETRGKRDEVRSRLERTERVYGELRQSAARYAELEKRYAAVKQLSDAANGRLDFETYAQTAYFERVLRAANLRLKAMSQNRYALLRKTDGGDARKRSGLELEVLDSYTGKARSANSLSGGESFLASLALALGLSDVVQRSAGGVRLDAMFIDEGFGSLDPDALELALRTLSDMAGSGRIIGIISHVAELGERVEKRLSVEKTPSGSKIRVI
jgi:exonuclease SbcC